eukprot:TRINITY_DN818_c0_g1_i1.p1 TRINITY_DN818_c0_g1~~TRINITY_DN818_c0_g1_i1.p1  ORF type:complete len:246 (+),score=52.99 TRINITY_DN818_c0_g1_i1:287-1024(+)
MRVSFVALLLVLLIALVSAETDYCKFSYNGEDYDLTEANHPTTDYVAYDYPNPKLGSNTYYIQICTTTITNCSGAGNTPTPVCQKDTNNNYHSCGQLNTFAVGAPSNNTFGPYNFQIAYKNGQQGRAVTILLKCNETVETGNVFQKVAEPVKPIYQVYFESNLACAGASTPSGSKGGLIFIIIVFALLGVYFIGGALYMKFARHAEGREIIPNHEFWFDLPSLIKDGCMFLVNKVRGRSGYSTVE